jgi:hypothetical protein
VIGADRVRQGRCGVYGKGIYSCRVTCRFFRGIRTIMIEVDFTEI